MCVWISIRECVSIKDRSNENNLCVFTDCLNSFNTSEFLQSDQITKDFGHIFFFFCGNTSWSGRELFISHSYYVYNSSSVPRWRKVKQNKNNPILPPTSSPHILTRSLFLSVYINQRFICRFYQPFWSIAWSLHQ